MQVPSMFTVVPRGMEKLHILGDIPRFSIHTLRLVGMEAELELREKLASIPAFAFLKNLMGLSRPTSSTIMP